MNKFVEMPEIKETTPPEFPFNPPETPTARQGSVPMIYVDEPKQTEYRVKAVEFSEPEDLEAELNAHARKDWQLVSIIPKEKQVFLVFCRRAEDRR
jgi:hypothetical protein